jgi:hypothetical protein
MGGEGSMMHANSSLKNNRKLISKRKERNTLSGSYANAELKEFPKATPEQLKEIRERIIKENKQASLKQILIFVILVLGLVLFFYFQ